MVTQQLFFRLPLAYQSMANVAQVEWYEMPVPCLWASLLHILVLPKLLGWCRARLAQGSELLCRDGGQGRATVPGFFDNSQDVMLFDNSGPSFTHT